MDPSVIPTSKTEGTANIAIVGAGPAALVLSIALARRGIRTTVFERDAHPEVAPRFNPDRSYTIDISGMDSGRCGTSTLAPISMTE